MANYINMQETEYDELQVRLAQIHRDILESEKEIRQDISALVDLNGGFYVKNISVKITGLLITVNKVMIINVANSFRESESEITNYVDSVIRADIVSN